MEPTVRSTVRTGILSAVVLSIVVTTALAVTAARSAGPSTVMIWGQDTDDPQLTESQGRLAYTHVNPETGVSGLYVTAVDGQQVQLLAGSDGRVYRDVVWSPDGQWLVFTSGSDATALGLWRVRPDGTERTELLDASLGSIHHPSPSPDGRVLAFARVAAGGSSTVWSSAIDGAGQQEIAAANGRAIEPSFSCSELTPTASVPEGWSPDGVQLLVTVRSYGCEAEFSETLAVDMATRRIASVVARDDSRPRWSPTGTEIAFDGMTITDRSGTTRRSLGRGQAPSWSPSGDLVFVRADDWSDLTDYGIWVAPGTDTSRSRLVAKPSAVRADAPQWSSDGSRIAYLGLHERGSTLWTVEAGGGEPTRVAGPETGYIINFDYAGGH